MNAAYSGVGSVRTTPPASWLRAASEAEDGDLKEDEALQREQVLRASLRVPGI